MPDPLGRALELVARYDAEVRELVPPDAVIFDAHLHLGRDIDGMVGDYDQLGAMMRRHAVTRAFMFCLHEPDRPPSFCSLMIRPPPRSTLFPYTTLSLSKNRPAISNARRS